MFHFLQYLTDRTQGVRRHSQPILTYRTIHLPYESCHKIPEDLYNLEPCTLTVELTAQPPGTQWPVYVDGSFHTGPQPFFGFVRREPEKRKSSDASDVYLHILPWDFMKLAECLTLFQKARKMPNDQSLIERAQHEWLSRYLPTVPTYYGSVNHRV
jgi:hypothetical protein